MRASRQLRDYPDVLTVTEVAEILGIGRTSLYRYLKRGSKSKAGMTVA